MGSYWRATVALGVLPYGVFHLVQWFFARPLGQELERRLLDRSPIDFVRYGISVEGFDIVIAAVVATGTWWISWTCYKNTNSTSDYSKRFGVIASQLIIAPVGLFLFGTTYLGIREDLVLVAVIAATGTIGPFVFKQLARTSPHAMRRRDN